MARNLKLIKEAETTTNEARIRELATDYPGSVGLNPCCPEDVQIQIMELDCKISSKIFDGLLANPNCSTRVLSLCIDRDIALIKALEHPNMTEGLLRKALNQTKNNFFKKRILSTKLVPDYILLEYVKDPDLQIRKVVAMHQNSTSSILEDLANDKEKEIRTLVLKHPNCSELARKTIENINTLLALI